MKKKIRYKCHNCNKYFYSEEKRDKHMLEKKHEHWLWRSRSLDYWTNTSKGKITFRRVSLSAVWIERNGNYLCTIEPNDLQIVLSEVLNKKVI